MLALRANRTVSADDLIDGLWGERPPASAVKNVQLYVSRLRKVLNASRSGAGIVTHGRGYELQLPDDAVDAARFEQLVGRARRDAERGVVNGAARAALELWHGAPLADVAEEPFAAPEIRRLEELRLRAIELAIDAELAAGRHGDVIGNLGTLLAEHPLHERFHAQRMLALYRAGRQSDALEAYRQARRRSASRSGSSPGPSCAASRRGSWGRTRLSTLRCRCGRCRAGSSGVALGYTGSRPSVYRGVRGSRLPRAPGDASSGRRGLGP